MNSRQKGAAGEREAAAALAAILGCEGKRSQQHSGTESTSDVLISATPNLWFEVKRVENLNVNKAIRVAGMQCGAKTPVLVHRKNGGEWLLTIRLKDLPAVVAEFAAALGKIVHGRT